MIKDRIWTLVSRKLSGEATASELAEIEKLIKNQANNELYLQAINEYWSIPPENDEEFLEATYHLHLNRLKQRGFDFENELYEAEPAYFDYQPVTKTNAKKRMYAALAAVSLFAALFILLFSREKQSFAATVETRANESEVVTKAGSRTKMQLPDGTTVWLNANSKLTYKNNGFGDKLRQVSLSGEAFFDVVKNAAVPFIIHTKRMEIKVLGTAFNVKAYPDERNSETSLVRGSIEITLKGRREKIMMKPNDKLVVANDEQFNNETGSTTSSSRKESFVSLGHLTYSPTINTIMETAWVDNKLAFDNESFSELAIKMERWYGVAINFDDEKMKDAHMTGTFEKESVTDALAALQILTPFKYSIKDNIITIAK